MRAPPPSPHCEKVVGLPEENTEGWGGLPKTRPILTLIHKFLYMEPPATGQLQLTFSYSVIDSPGVSVPGFLLWQVMILFVCLSLQFGGQCFPCDFNSLMAQRKAVDFQFV